MLIANPATLVEDYQHIWSGDPALNREVDDFDDIYQRWLETGDPAELQKILIPGEKPALFTLEHPRGKLRRQLRDLVLQESKIENGQVTRWSEAALLAVAAFSIAKVENLVNPKGKPIVLKRVMDSDAAAMRLDDHHIDLLDSIDESILAEIGMRVFALMVPSGNS
jgi:hypothetical protein